MIDIGAAMNHTLQKMHGTTAHNSRMLLAQQEGEGRFIVRVVAPSAVFQQSAMLPMLQHVCQPDFKHSAQACHGSPYLYLIMSNLDAFSLALGSISYKIPGWERRGKQLPYEERPLWPLFEQMYLVIPNRLSTLPATEPDSQSCSICQRTVASTRTDVWTHYYTKINRPPEYLQISEYTPRTDIWTHYWTNVNRPPEYP